MSYTIRLYIRYQYNNIGYINRIKTEANYTNYILVMMEKGRGEGMREGNCEERGCIRHSGKKDRLMGRKRPAGNFICRLNCVSEKAGWEKVTAIFKTLHMTTIISISKDFYVLSYR